MEITDKLLLQKTRSIPAVISDGYRLYTGNFKRLFRASWIVALIYALCFAFMMNTLINDVLAIIVLTTTYGTQVLTFKEYTPDFIKAGISVLLFVVAMLALASYAFGASANHQNTGQINRPVHWWGTFHVKPFQRLLVASGWMMLILLVVAAGFGGIIYGVMSAGIVDSLWKSIATIVLLIILISMAGAALLPLAYPIVRFVVNGNFTWRPPFSGYSTGLRHWNLLFVTLIVTAIITSLLTLICELPAFVIGTANAKAYAGSAMGDPLGLPENMELIAFAAFFIAGFVQAYVHLYSIFPLYYAYGSIEQQQKELQDL